jgi:GNAT superfamily N-acetyltransferase
MAGALERSRDRHAEYFAREAATRWEHWNGPGWRDAVDWVEAELGNLRAAYQWSVEVSVYIDPRAHRSGVGRALYTALFDVANERKRDHKEISICLLHSFPCSHPVVASRAMY